MTRAMKISEDLRPVSELKSRAGEVLEQVERTGRPVVLTRYGRGVAVVLSLGAYEELQAAAERGDLREAIAEAEREYAAGHYIEHEDVDRTLAEWESGG